MAKSISINISKNINIDPHGRRKGWDGYWDDTALQQVFSPLLKAVELCGLCQSPSHLTRAVLSALGDHMANGVQRCVATIRLTQDMASGRDLSEIERTLEIAEDLLLQLGLDGTPAGADDEAPVLVPAGMLPHLEFCLIYLDAWLNEEDLEEIEEPTLIDVYVGGKVLMGDVEVDHE